MIKNIQVNKLPYPGVNTFNYQRHVADGIAFSARDEETQPKSLGFITRAIENDLYNGLNLPLSIQTDLTPWAAQGILMLNSELSTNLGVINGHKGLWSPFITYLLNFLNDHNRGLIFVFLGKQAQGYMPLIRESRHFVLAASHPSSANYNGGTWEHNGLFARIDKIMKETHGLSFSYQPEPDFVV
jgi:uracil-DNA glycosylase